MRDQFARDLQIAVSGHGVRGTFVHLYLNGLYWGLYNLVERPDQRHAAEYFGGDNSDWFAINHSGVVSGDSTRWDHLVDEVVLGDLTQPEAWAELGQLLDVDAYLDYLILNFYLGTGDWPYNNWYAVQRNAPAGPARFFVWDAEETLDDAWGSDGAWVPPLFLPGVTNDEPIVAIWHAARHNPEFMLRLADRVHALCFGDGPLSEGRVQESWLALHDSIDAAVCGEAARWGDQLASLDLPTRTREDTFIPERDRVLNGPLVGNAERLVAALRVQGYYPAMDPPAISATADGVEVSNPNDTGVVWVTVDGTDPRGARAGPSSTAQRATAIAVAGPALVSARVEDNRSWSALAVATVD